MKLRCPECRSKTPCEVADGTATCPVGHTWRVHGPGIVRKAFNFGVALAAHVATGGQYRTQAEIRDLLAICRGCDYFQATDDDGGICTHKRCGCGLKTSAGLFNKLAHSSQSCPEGKWQ